MKANELRIGNWFIQYDEPEKFDGDFYHLSDIKFITLTPEWLFKFGFEWNGGGGKFLTIFTPCGKALVHIEDDFFKFNGVTIEVQIKYVHQLQNLYFALTQEELTINEL